MRNNTYVRIYHVALAGDGGRLSLDHFVRNVTTQPHPELIQNGLRGRVERAKNVPLVMACPARDFCDSEPKTHKTFCDILFFRNAQLERPGCSLERHEGLTTLLWQFRAI